MVRYFFLFAAIGFAQDAERIRASMEPALEKQRASVERQVKPAAPASRAPERSRSNDCERLPAATLLEMIGGAAERTGVSESLLREVARQESGFRPCVVSSAGAEGLMQLMPATQQEFGVDDPFDPRQSLMAGSAYLKRLLERYNGDLRLALAAYNAGPGRVHDEVPAIPETQRYVRDIVSRLP